MSRCSSTFCTPCILERNYLYRNLYVLQDRSGQLRMPAKFVRPVSETVQPLIFYEAFHKNNKKVHQKSL